MDSQQFAMDKLKSNLIKASDIDFLIDELSMYDKVEDELIDTIKDWYSPEFLDDLIGYLYEYYEDESSNVDLIAIFNNSRSS